MKRIDMHVHTTASDGTCSPAEVVKLAKEKGLAAIAITDHDTVSGYEEAKKAGEELGIEVVPGIEISTRYLGPVHILGYYLDTASPVLNEVSQWLGGGPGPPQPQDGGADAGRRAGRQL